MDDQCRAAKYTRRQFLEYRQIMAGEPWWVARESVSSAAVDGPERDLDEQLTWAQWESEEGPGGVSPTLTGVS